MMVDEKVTVARVREHAHFHGERWSIRIREVAADAFSKDGFVLGVTVAIDGFSDDGLMAMMVFPDFEARHVVRREAIVTALRCLHVENREGRGLEVFRLVWLSPQQHLTLGEDEC